MANTSLAGLIDCESIHATGARLTTTQKMTMTYAALRPFLLRRGRGAVPE